MPQGLKNTNRCPASAIFIREVLKEYVNSVDDSAFRDVYFGCFCVPLGLLQKSGLSDVKVIIFYKFQRLFSGRK